MMNEYKEERKERIENSKLSSVSSRKRHLFFDNRIWLSSEDAAEFLGTTPEVIRKWVYQGKLKRKKLFGRLRFDESELALLIVGG